MIALIAAMQAEVDEMLKLTTDSKKVIKDSFAFWEGKLENQSIVIMLSGVGKGYGCGNADYQLSSSSNY